MKIEEWYRKTLKKHREEIIKSAIVTITFSISYLLYTFFTGKTFDWETIEPISEPSIYSRLFYSALVFVTLGAFLYKVGFYKFLYSLYRGTKNGWREYQKMKSGIWGILILLMFFVIVPFVVDLLNNIASLLFNIYKLLLYLLPSIVITATVIGIIYFVRRKLNVM